MNRQRQPAHCFHVGDKVWLSLKNVHTDRPCKKFDWIHGKYTVTRAIGSHVYELDIPGRREKKFHVSLLHPATNDPHPSQTQTNWQPPAIINEEGDEEYLVEEILEARVHHKQKQVLVKWIGWQEATWEPRHEFVDTAALEHFKRQEGHKEKGGGE